MSDVTGLASNSNVVEQMTSKLGYQPGVDDLIDESNRRLVETMMEAEDYLERKIGMLLWALIMFFIDFNDKRSE